MSTMASNEAEPSPFYTHQTDLDDISQPTAILHSLSKPLALRIPQDKDLQPLINFLADPENTKTDLSVASLTPEERESVCRQWLTLNDPLNYLNFVVIDTTTNGHEEVVGIAGLGWIGPTKDGDASKRAGAAGVMINPTARRKGLVAEALKMVIDYGLNVLELAEVRIGTISQNVAMRRLVEVKFKMQPEVQEEGDRFGNDVLWRIDKEKWLHYLEQEG